LRLPPVASSVNSNHLPFVDGLRALAILWVLGFHSLGPIAGCLARGGGWFGVDVFFVISGFLITGILLREQKGTGSISLKNFYIRRGLRLLPAYYVLLAVVCFLNPFHSKDIGAAVGIALIYLSNYDLGLNWGHTLGSGLETTWSLAIEEQFYFVWPSLILFLRKHLWQGALAAIVSCELWKAYLLTHGAHWMRVSAGFDTKADILMLGCLAAIALTNERSRNWLNKAFSNVWIAPALFIALLYYVRGIGHPGGATTVASQLFYWELRVPLLAALTAVLIISLCIRPNSVVARVLSTPILTWIGRISYSMYLWHILAFVTVINYLGALGVWHKELIGYAAAIATAAASYYLIERPFLRLKERFNKPASRSALSSQKTSRVPALMLSAPRAFILEDGSLLP
jgi:peptidoglycan/LPS O-acetylase OafA/YrhL